MTTGVASVGSAPAVAPDSERLSVRLTSARAERTWIEAQGGATIEVPKLAFVVYEAPAVVYGRRGGDEVLRVARGATLGIDVLQRRTGGGAVYVGPWMLGIHAALPRSHPVGAMGVVASLRWFGEVLQGALAQVGVPAARVDAAGIDASAARVLAAGLGWVCFAGLSHGELVDAVGRKLLGTCQWRGRWGVVLSGGLLLDRTPWEEFEFVHHGIRLARSGLRDWVSEGVSTAIGRAALRDSIERSLFRNIHRVAMADHHALESEGES